MPAVAVIIPARNEVLRMGACLESIHRALAASGLTAEVVVVDDDSTDATAEVARAGGAAVLRQRPRSGPLAAWMRGAASTSAPLLILVDADCQVASEAFAALVGRFEENRVGVVAGRSQPAGAGPSGLVGHSAGFSSALLHRIKSRLEDHDFLPIGRLMAVRREAWQVVDPGLVPCDRAVAHLARRAGWRIVYEPRAVVFFEPLTTLSALRADYLRTRAMGGRAPLSYDRLSRGMLIRAVWASACAAPLDALAWATCRVVLLAQQRVRPGQPALSSWPG